MNTVYMMGRLACDPEVKAYGHEGKTLTRFILAVDREYSKGKEKQADFFPCTAFGRTGEFIGNWANKGARMVVTGRVRIDLKEVKGEKRTYTSVIVDRVELIDWPDKVQTREENPMGAFGNKIGTEEEIPF